MFRRIVIEWFRKQAHDAGGASFQTMINDVLRQAMEARSESIEATLRRVIREGMEHHPDTPAFSSECARRTRGRDGSGNGHP